MPASYNGEGMSEPGPAKSPRTSRPRWKPPSPGSFDFEPLRCVYYCTSCGAPSSEESSRCHRCVGLLGGSKAGTESGKAAWIIGVLWFYAMAQGAVALVMQAAHSGGASWDELSTIWKSYSICALPALSLGIATLMTATNSFIAWRPGGTKIKLSAVATKTKLLALGCFVVSVVGFFLSAPLMMRYAKNGSVERARLVARIYDPAIRQALSCSANSPVTQVNCRRHSLIVYGPGTSATWEPDEATRKYNSAVDPDWVVAVGDKPEIVVIVAEGQTTSTGSEFLICNPSCVDAGGASVTAWGIKFVSLSLNAVVRTEVIKRSDGISSNGFVDSIDRSSLTPPDSDEVIDVIKRVVNWQ
jgi:hypothetical protein